MTKFNLSVILFYVVFLLFILNHCDNKYEKLEKQIKIQNETTEIMQQNEKEMLNMIDTLIKNDEKFLETFCEFHFCDKSEENLIKNNVY